MKIYRMITEHVIELLKKNIVPWRQPWAKCAALPLNYITRRVYRGINVFTLTAAGYSSPYWLTARQARDCGGRIKRGEKPIPVVYWRWLDVEKTEHGIGRTRKAPKLAHYALYNIEQTRGLNIPTPPQAICLDPIAEAKHIVDNMPLRPRIVHGRSRTSFHYLFGIVEMPWKKEFASREEYYTTLFQQLAESTGHKSRLGRHDHAKELWLGEPEYAWESMLAVMGAAFLCQRCGITAPLCPDSPEYIARWVERLSEDPKIVIRAGTLANRAADYINGIHIMLEDYPGPVEMEYDG